VGLPLRRGRGERSDRPLRGFKLAFPQLSADGARTGFSGVTVGRGHVYRAVDEAVCVQGFAHGCPSRWCDCGFYCFHEFAAARDLGCDPEYRGAVLLEVAASGRYLRHEHGLRYGRQRVRRMWLGRCGCGRPAGVLADSGTGSVGWRRLVAVCQACRGARPALEPGPFARASGGEVAVSVERDAFGSLARLPGDADPATAGAVAVLTAELALLQARLDDAQARLDELTRRAD
jgi:hypothetical protein